MTRINKLRSMKETNSIAWGKQLLSKNSGAILFAAVLIICSVTVGCSSEKPKPVSSNNQIPVTQAPIPVQPAPVLQAENKPAPKKVVHKKPATVNYTDKTYGVTFEYPRRYAIETGNAANELIEASTVPMNFVQPGGVALAAVELPETNYANTDFSFAFFNVSVHKNLTADQCNEFAVPQPKMTMTASPSDTKPEAATPAVSAETAKSTAAEAPAASQTPASAESKPVVAASPEGSTAQPDSGSKLLLGDLELRATEAVSGEGARQSDSKYFHVYQNNACYEFALNVTTMASSDGLIKHVNRDRVFDRLEQILSTVKISPTAPEVAADAPTQTPTPVTPAQ